jgi:hypothetical protein
MIDDGYANFGGGGSIYWEVGDGKPGDSKPGSRDEYGRYKINGVDDPPDPDEGKLFKMTIRNIKEILIGQEGNDLILAVPIDKNGQYTPPRIVVQWAYKRDELPKGLGPVARRSS